MDDKDKWITLAIKMYDQFIAKLKIKRPIYGKILEDGFVFSFSNKIKFLEKGESFLFYKEIKIIATPGIYLALTPEKYAVIKDGKQFFEGEYRDILCIFLKTPMTKKLITFGPINFKNDTDYCYLNVIFQALLCCSYLNTYIYYIENPEGAVKSYKELLGALFPGILLGKFNPVNVKHPGEFVGVGDFQPGKQCDAGEFLESRVFPELSKGTPLKLPSYPEDNDYKKSINESQTYSAIDYFFGIVINYRRASLEFYFEPKRFSFRRMITLKTGNILEDLNEYKKGQVNFLYLSQYLVFRKYLPGMPDLPIELEMNPFLSQNECSLETKYRLLAVILYSGTGATGHYYGIFYRRKKYYLIDSLRESEPEIKESEIKKNASKSATITFYERKSVEN